MTDVYSETPSDPETDERSGWRPYLLGAGLLLGGALVATLLVMLAPSPPRQAPPPQTPLVSTVQLEVERGSLAVEGNGTVRPAREIDLTAEVAGRLTDVADRLQSGGRFRAGDVLAQVDRSDYRSAVRQAQAAVTQARFSLIQARQEAEVARQEYEQLRDRSTRPVPDPDSTELGRLVYREPQLEQARANLQSAKAQLETARTNLDRTSLEAPFDGQVRTKHVDLGGYVTPGTPIATVYGTEYVEVVVSLTSREAALIDGLWNAQPGSRSDIDARVVSEYGGRRFAWDGYVDRVEGAIDTQTRTVDVVVRVPDPYDRRGVAVTPQIPEGPPAAERPPLQIGTYTSVRIEAQENRSYAEVPRRAVRNRESGSPPVLWTVVGDSMLVERPVSLIQTVEQTAYVETSLPNGTPIITSDLRVQTDSMRVRL